MSNAKSYIDARYQQIEDCDPLSDDLKDRMRRVICGHAKGKTQEDQVADAELLMMMLGVHPSQEEEDVD